MQLLKQKLTIDFQIQSTHLTAVRLDGGPGYMNLVCTRARWDIPIQIRLTEQLRL